MQAARALESFWGFPEAWLLTVITAHAIQFSLALQKWSWGEGTA